MLDDEGFVSSFDAPLIMLVGYFLQHASK